MQTETAEAVRQYLHTCVLDGFPVYATGWRLVSAPYSSLFAVRHQSQARRPPLFAGDALKIPNGNCTHDSYQLES
nr:hypothetical protein [uncultured Duganella sp.]